MVKKKSKRRFEIVRYNDCCPKCLVHFSSHLSRVLWRDVVECLDCGHIWVLDSVLEYYSY